MYFDDVTDLIRESFKLVDDASVGQREWNEDMIGKNDNVRDDSKECVADETETNNNSTRNAVPVYERELVES